MKKKNLASLRRKSREIALQLLYQFDIRSEFNIEDAIFLYDENGYLDLLDGNVYSEKERNEIYNYAFSLIRGLFVELDEIFVLLRNNVIGWRLERMVSVDKMLIILALYEGLISRKVPVAVAISEVVELSKVYGTSDSARFINGVLGRIIRKENQEVYDE